MWRERTSGLRALRVSAWVLVGAAALCWLAPRTALAYAHGGRSKSEVAAKLAWLSDELKLNPSQRKKMRPHINSLQHKLLSIEGNPKLSPEQKQIKSKIAAEGALANMRTILNPQQKAKLDSIKEEAYTKLAAEKAAQAQQAPPAQQQAPAEAPSSWRCLAGRSRRQRPIANRARCGPFVRSAP